MPRGRGEQSAVMLDLRTSCLERRRYEMGALAAIFAKGTDADLLKRAVQSALSLPRIEECADTQSLAQAVPLPVAPAARAKVENVRRRIDELTALWFAGKYKDGLPIAQAIAIEAKEASFPPVEAEALFWRGQHERATGDGKSAERTFLDVLPIAARAHDDARIATTWAQLVFVVGSAQARPLDVMAWRPAIETAAARAGEDTVEAAAIWRSFGSVLVDKGDYDEGIRLIQRAIGIQERQRGPEHTDVAIARLGLAIALDGIEHHQEAREEYERVLAIFEKAYGPDHPQVAAALHNLALAEVRRERWAEARVLYMQALTIREKAFGPEHVSVARTLSDLSSVEGGQRGIVSERYRSRSKPWPVFPKTTRAPKKQKSRLG